VGINYRPAEDFGNGSFVFPVEAVRYLRTATVNAGVVQRSWFGVELLPSDPIAVVQGIRQGSPAGKANMVKGDILLQIGPRAIHGYSDAINAFYYLKEGETETVRLMRGAEMLEVEVIPELVPAPEPLPVKKEAALSSES
jgi:S1-C subfamily serine protease